MIDNVILLITGTLHQRPIAELVPKCHPLGSFEQMEAVSIASNPTELFNAILVDTPLGKTTKLFLLFFSKLLILCSLEQDVSQWICCVLVKQILNCRSRASAVVFRTYSSNIY